MSPSFILAADSADAPPVTFLRHGLEWIGRFHVLTVHFPIALIAAAAMAEGWLMVIRQKNPSSTVRYCLALGAAGAVMAAALGWPHAAWGGFSDSPSMTLEWHRWLGTITAVVAIVTFIAGERDARRRLRSPLFRAMLFALALMVGVSAHLGGTLTHGDAFLKW